LRKTTRILLIVLAAVLIAAAIASRKQQQLPPPVVQADPFMEVLDKISASEQIGDPYQRCVAYPQPRGYQWSRETLEAFCADVFSPSFQWIDISRMISDKEVAQIDARLDRMIESYLAGTAPEDALNVAYGNFNTESVVVRRQIDKWLEQSPKSPHALAARGMSKIAAGWEVRGTQWTVNTPGSAFKQMRKEVERGVADLQKALELNPRIIPAYLTLISAAQLDSQPVLGATALQRLLVIDPKNFYGRAAYIFMLSPKWGGSQEQMDAVAADAQPRLKENPRLVNLTALALGYRGMRANNDKQYAVALPLFEAATAAGPSGKYLLNAAYAAIQVKDYRRAIELYTQVLRFEPMNLSALIWRSEAFLRIEQDERARKDLETALNIAPAHVGANRSYAYLMIKQKNHAGAALKLQYLHDNDPTDQWAAQTLADLYAFHLQRYDAAAALADRMLKDNPKNGAAWLVKFEAVEHLRPAELRGVLTDYVAQADEKDPQQRIPIGRAKEYLKKLP
jgi:tetratricopeptide (TPR) repeat protein